MTETTSRLALPLLAPGQAQKELFHNEALIRIDALLTAAVEAPPQNAPPATPANGTCWLVGSAPTGAWAEQPGKIAAFDSSGWRFIAPTEGMRLLVRSTQVVMRFAGGAWQGGQAIASPAGGAIVDGEARAAISAILAAMRSYGLIAE